ncbi:hypothetical protein FRC08_007796 [Ceratobasidium sp. 394]|nr:hypothetical protein FRC08_007796 [Ceratobasidium sp. 394]
MKPRDFEIRLAGRKEDNPVDGLLGIDQCTWPVRAEIVPLKGALELKKVEIEVVVYEYGEIRIKSSAQTSRDINVEKILYHGRVVVFDASKSSKSCASYIKITQPLSISHCFEIPTTLPGAIKCHKDPASVVWKLNISVSRKNPGLFSHDPHIESYEYSGARSFLPHTLTVQPYILQGRDDRRGVAWAIEFPRSFFAAGECLSGKLTLRRFSAKSKFSIRALSFELSGSLLLYPNSSFSCTHQLTRTRHHPSISHSFLWRRPRVPWLPEPDQKQSPSRPVLWQRQHPRGRPAHVCTPRMHARLLWATHLRSTPGSDKNEIKAWPRV